MKSLIIYKSIHRQNTGKVATVMAESLGARLVKVDDILPGELENYELIGFGSGIYNDRFHKDLMRFIAEMPVMDKLVFIFFTAAVLKDTYPVLIKERLAEKGCKVIGEFSCPGEFIPLGLNIGRELPGVLVIFSRKNQGRPNAGDLDNARVFAKNLIHDMSESSMKKRG